MKSVLVSWNITNHQELQKRKPCDSFIVKDQDYNSFEPDLKNQKHCKKHQRSSKSIALQYYNEGCCAPDSSKNDY